MTKRIGYLSGAPRVSTRSDAEAGGPRAHILGFIAALRGLGHEVRLFIAGDRVPPRWTNAGSAETPLRSWWGRLAADLVRLALGWRNSRRAWEEMSGRVDWVYERFAVLQSLGRRPQRHGTPWILETNGLFFQEANLDRRTIGWPWLARRLELRAYRQCDVLVCVTHCLEEMVVEEAGLPEDKIVVVPNGVDTDFFDPGRHPILRVGDGLVVGFVGGLIAWQGIDLLLEAMASAEASDVSCVVVGDGATREAWAARARTLGVANRVNFVGRVPREEVPAYIAGFDVGFSGQLPTRIGRMYHSPLKLYEYMAMAKPVLAAAYEDARRVVIEGENGFLFEPGSRSDLERALRKVRAARDCLPALGAAARAKVVAEHTWRSRVRAMMPEIERILHPRW